MSAAIQGSEVGSVVAETSHCSAHTEQETALKNEETIVGTDNPTEVAPGSTRDATDEELLGHSEGDGDKEEIPSDSLTHTIIPKTLSDSDTDLNPYLPTRFGGKDQTTLGDVESEKPESDEGKSAKIVPVEARTGSPEVEKASNPFEVKDEKLVDISATGGDEEFGLKDELFMMNPYRMSIKMDFRYHNHQKSGKYFLPEKPPVVRTGKISGLIISLRLMANFNPYEALYQQFYAEEPMIRLECPHIDDLKPLKIIYWDNLFLYINGGKPVGVKIPTEVNVEWLDLHIDAKKKTDRREQVLVIVYGLGFRHCAKSRSIS